MYRIIIIFTLILSSLISVKAQYWKQYRHSVVASIGMNQFMGDLGGGAKDAAHFFGVRDMDLASTRPVISAAYQYRIIEALAFKVGGSWAILAANDKFSSSLGRKSRNLHFKTNLFSVFLHGEYYFIDPIKRSGYSHSFSHGLHNISAYVFTGVSFNLFNPKAKLDGKWYELQPLGTEGQGIDGNPAPYKKSAIGIPIGLGAKYYLGGNLSVGVEISNTYTTSDYIDDAHGSYFDNDKIRAKYGDIAATLADRHLDYDGNPHIKPKPSGHKARGNPDHNDSFIFTVVTFTYKLRRDKRGLPKFR